MVSCCVAAAALLALACVNQAKYGTNAATNSSALGPCHAPVCTSASTALIPSATAVYSALSELYAPAAANSDPGPGPPLNNVECTSGGAAIQTGAVIVSSPQCDTTTPPPHHVPHSGRPNRPPRHRRDQALPRLGPPPLNVRRRER